MSLYFLALLPPQHIQEQANQIKQHFADYYASRAALKSPPHITLQPPFEWEDGEISRLEAVLSEFATQQPKIPLTLNGFAAFPPRVIYIHVEKSLEAATLQANLITHLAQKLTIVDKTANNRPFAPHLTVAYRDLTKPAFKTAWVEFKEQQFYFEFTAEHLTLLLHNGKRWNIKSEFVFSHVSSRE
ncbi:MAG TPA: 2'-5' RNA ligase family protein [Nostocaceae cyanobacterium]|nr:2'-5' RNA ligase family protein [Nostocaceae cyanobacterium]